MKSLPIVCAGLAFALAAGAAQAADRRESRDVAGFNSVSLAAPLDLDIVQGDKEGLVLEGDADEIAKIETVVEGGSLKIRMRERHWGQWSKLRGHLMARDLHALDIAGSGDIKSTQLRSGDFEISISGSGDVAIGTLAADRLRVSIAGSGDVNVAGKVDRTELSIAGSGDVNAKRLEARDAKVSITGAGDATVWAHETVDVSILGSGDVRYYGDPRVSKRVLGAGSVVRLAATP